MADQLLKADLPLFVCGKKTFGVYSETYVDKQGKQRSSHVLGEVEALVDPVKRIVTGWKPRYKGQRIQTEKREDLDAFLASFSR